SPSPIGAFSFDSRCTSGPPARLIAPATPPPCFSSVLAALAIASTSSFVTSASTTSSSATSISSPNRPPRTDHARARGPRGALLEPRQGLLPRARAHEARPLRVLPRGGGRLSSQPARPADLDEALPERRRRGLLLPEARPGE